MVKVVFNYILTKREEDIALQLEQSGIYEIVGAIAYVNKKGYTIHHGAHQVNQELFQSAHFLDHMELAQPKHVHRLDFDNKKILGDDVYKAFSTIELMFLKISDRYGIAPVSVQKRRRLYFCLLHYYFGYFERVKPDLFISLHLPHSIQTYLFFEVAKYLNIPIIIQTHTQIDGYSLFYLEQQYIAENISSNYLDDHSVWELQNMIGEHEYRRCFENFGQSRNLAYYKSRDYSSCIKNNKSHFYNGFLRRVLPKLLSTYLIGLYPRVIGYENHRFVDQLALVGITSERKYRFNYRIKQILKSYRQNLLYNSLSGIVDIVNVNYIFFPLHVQPELTTMPMGGTFDDLILAVELIVKAIENTDIKLYIKEHPAQFNLNLGDKASFRFKGYYEYLVSLPQVRLVSLEMDSAELIEKATCVATITGTAGWEALNKGIPVMAFGQAFYSKCNSVFNVSSVDSCKRALECIQVLNPSVVRRDLLIWYLFLKHKDFLVEADMSDNVVAGEHHISREEQINNLVKKIDKIVQKVKGVNIEYES